MGQAQRVQQSVYTGPGGQVKQLPSIINFPKIGDEMVALKYCAGSIAFGLLIGFYCQQSTPKVFSSIAA